MVGYGLIAIRSYPDTRQHPQQAAPLLWCPIAHLQAQMSQMWQMGQHISGLIGLNGASIGDGGRFDILLVQVGD